jgi:hypothetical protein
MVENYQFCAEQARGDWLAFIPSDDLAEPIYVAALLRGITENPGAVAIRGGQRYVDEGGHVMGSQSLLSIPRYSSADRAFKEQLQGPKAFFQSTVISRSALGLAGGFDVELQLYGDWGLWVALSKIGGFARVKHIVSRYRLWSRSDRGDSRIPTELRDEMRIYSHHIFPHAEQTGSDLARLARRASANRAERRLADIGTRWNSSEIAQHRDLLIDYGRTLGGSSAVDRLLAGDLRVPHRRATLKSGIRRVAEGIVGWD